MVRVSIKRGQIIKVGFALRCTPLTPNKQQLQWQPPKIKAATHRRATARTKSPNFCMGGAPKTQQEKTGFNTSFTEENSEPCSAVCRCHVIKQLIHLHARHSDMQAHVAAESTARVSCTSRMLSWCAKGVGRVNNRRPLVPVRLVNLYQRSRQRACARHSRC